MSTTSTVADAAREAEQQAEAAIATVRQGVTDQVEQQIQLAKGLVEIVQNAALDLYGSAFTVAEKAVGEATKSFDTLVKKGEAFQAGQKAEDVVEDVEAKAQAAADSATERFNEAMGTFDKARQQFQDRLDTVLAESMRRAGLPTRDDVASLRASVDALNARVVDLSK